jgi:purine-binding chemotaxis protein CheW
MVQGGGMSTEMLEAVDTTQVVAFRLDDRLFGVDIRDVKEVNEEVAVTHIHHAPKSVSGYLNIRGQIHLVVDLRTEFGFEASPTTPRSRVIIFKTSVDEPFGVLVDSVEDILEIDPERLVDRRSREALAKRSELRQARKELCQGIYPLSKELLMLLNAHAILPKEGN